MTPSETDGLKDNLVSATVNTGLPDSTSGNKSSIYSLATHPHATQDSNEGVVHAAVDKDDKSNSFTFHCSFIIALVYHSWVCIKPKSDIHCNLSATSPRPKFKTIAEVAE